MDAVTYPHGGVQRRLDDAFVAARIPVAGNADLAGRLQAIWTPGLLFLDGRETVHHRAFGYHPPEEFEHLLHVGHGLVLLGQGDAGAAAVVLERAAHDAERSAVQPEALYWAGVARYRNGDAEGMKPAWTRLLDLYPDSLWAHKVGYVRPRSAAA